MSISIKYNFISTFSWCTEVNVSARSIFKLTTNCMSSCNVTRKIGHIWIRNKVLHPPSRLYFAVTKFIRLEICKFNCKLKRVGTYFGDIVQPRIGASIPRFPCKVSLNEALYRLRNFFGGLCTAVYGRPLNQKSRTTIHVRAVYKTCNTLAALSCGETLAICI